LCYFPVFRVRPWTDEPFIGDVRAQQLSNPRARAPGERRQPMRGAPPLSQGRRWGMQPARALRMHMYGGAADGGVFACEDAAVKMGVWLYMEQMYRAIV
jgi:hypothetical protein